MKSISVAIIGAGPAGASAAIQVRRYGIEMALIDRQNPGGLAVNASLIENFIGFPEGISGHDYCTLLQKQLKNAGIEYLQDTVKSIHFQNDRFILAGNRQEYRAEIIIVATGTKPKLHPAINIDKRNSPYIHYDVTTLSNVKDETIAIIGGGDGAFDYSCTLAQRNDVTIYNRSEDKKCLPILNIRVKNDPSIKYKASHELKDVKRQETGLVLEFKTASGTVCFEHDHLLIAIGREPDKSCLEGIASATIRKLGQDGRLYLVGDVHRGLYRQIAIACGDGVMAGMQIHDFISRGIH